MIHETFVYRVSCIFNTQNYINEILYIDTREHTIFFSNTKKYTKNFYIHDKAIP